MSWDLKEAVEYYGRQGAPGDQSAVISLLREVQQENGGSIPLSAPEEIAYKNGWITRDELLQSAQRYGKSPYGAHLKAVADGKLRY